MQIIGNINLKYLTYAKKYAKILKKGNDGEGTEGVFKESRGR